MSHVESAVDRIFALLERAAHADYVGERVSQLAHALQAAHLAERAGAPDHEVFAALLHDIGHVCAAEGSASMGGHGVAHHEDVGADYLAELGLGRDVTELVRGHVAAKRYLVSARPEYRARLSDASRITLEHQGGAMTSAECEAFASAPGFEAVLRVRAWDEAAKELGAEVPGLEHYRVRLERRLRA
jgi:phosphonate degradation associated HDIG domain protein